MLSSSICHHCQSPGTGLWKWTRRGLNWMVGRTGETMSMSVNMCVHYAAASSSVEVRARFDSYELGDSIFSVHFRRGRLRKNQLLRLPTYLNPFVWVDTTKKNACVFYLLPSSWLDQNSIQIFSFPSLLIYYMSHLVSPRSLATRSPARSYSRNWCQWHSTDMVNPSLSAAFNLERDGLHACSFVQFLVRNFVGPVDSQNSSETCILKNF